MKSAHFLLHDQPFKDRSTDDTRLWHSLRGTLDFPGEKIFARGRPRSHEGPCPRGPCPLGRPTPSPGTPEPCIVEPRRMEYTVALPHRHIQKKITQRHVPKLWTLDYGLLTPENLFYAGYRPELIVDPFGSDEVLLFRA
jgi:hypothetical protein